MRHPLVLLIPANGVPSAGQREQLYREDKASSDKSSPLYSPYLQIFSASKRLSYSPFRLIVTNDAKLIHLNG